MQQVSLRSMRHLKPPWKGSTTIAEPLAQYKESNRLGAMYRRRVQQQCSWRCRSRRKRSGPYAVLTWQRLSSAKTPTITLRTRVQAESGVTTTREALTTHAEASVLAADISGANAAATHSEELEAARKEAEAAAKRAASALDALHEAAAARTAEADSNADEKLKSVSDTHHWLRTDKHEAALARAAQDCVRCPRLWATQSSSTAKI